MKKLLALLLAMIMVFTLVACVGPNTTTTTQNGNDGTTVPPTTGDPDALEKAKYGGHLDLLINNTPTNLDPAKSTGVWNYPWTTLVYEAPLTRDAEGNIRPNVCEFELSEDQLTLKLWVREGVTFHDGSAVEIEDVVASVKRAVHKSPRNYVAAYIKDVTVDDKGVATFTFTEYNERTMYYIASVNPLISVMPKEIAEKYSYESGEVITAIEDAIGTGPYKVTEFATEEHVSFARYDGYVAVAEGYTGFAAPKKAYLDTITVWRDADTSATNLGMLSGLYDLRGAAGSEFIDQFVANGLNRLDKKTTSGEQIIFNTYGKGIVSGDNADMRKAICAAIDFPELLSQLNGITIEESGCCPAIDGIYYTDVFEKADYMGADNVELSKQYQKAAGYNGEELQIAMCGELTVEFTLICGYLDAAGIKYKINMMEQTAWEEFVANPENAWDIQYSYLSMANTPTMLNDNLMKVNYNSAQKDTLMAELNGMKAGSAEYIAKWHELAEQMVDDCATVFANQIVQTWWMNPDLNFDFDGLSPYIFNAYWTNPDEHAK